MNDRLTDAEHAFNNGLLAAIAVLEQELGGLPAAGMRPPSWPKWLGHYRAK
jgi:hypothetical protein